MNKKIFLMLPACVLMGAVALAAGGTEDPLASLSYLTGSYTTAVETQVDQRLDASDQAILAAASDGTLAQEGADTWTERRMKEGDILQGSTGAGVLLLAAVLLLPFLEGLIPGMDSGDVLVVLILLLLLSEGNEDSGSVLMTLAIFLFLQ